MLLVTALAVSLLMPDPAAIHLFDYEASAPLDLRTSASQVVEGVTVQDANYASPRGGRVPATVVVPSGQGPFAGLVFMHWGEWDSAWEGDRSEFLPEALVMARYGVVSILIDAPFRRAEGFTAPTNDRRTDAEKRRDTCLGLVIDLRRAVDVLIARPDIDAARIGFVGHGGIGGTWGGTLAGIEPRLSAFVLMGGVPTWPGLSDDHPRSHRFREKRSEYASAFAAIEPLSLVGRAARGTILFQFGRHDRFVSARAAAEFIAAAGASHEARWYAVGHDFRDDQSARDRRAWLATRLKLPGWPPTATVAPGEVFDYDRAAPLDVKTTGTERVEGVTIADLTYASPTGGRVPAYIVAPAGKGSYGGLIFMHWGQGDRSEFLGDALAMAQNGAVSILIDAPHLRPVGPSAPALDSRSADEKERDYTAGLIVDLRRAVDVLLARGDVDASRIGFVGHSLGAVCGGVLAGVEPRIASFVLVAGGIGRPDGPMSTVAGWRYVGNVVPGSILFQFGTRDAFLSEQTAAEQYPRVFGPSQDIRWYVTAHEFNDDRSAHERREWLATRLRLGR